MNKKFNTVLFILAGTITNLLLAVFFIVLLMVVVFQIDKAWPGRGEPLFPFVFIAGIIAAMIVYQRLSHWVVDRFNLADKLDPIIQRKRRRKITKQDQ